MKKAFYILFSAVFFLAISIPVIFLPFYEQESTEKRKLSQPPSVLKENGKLNPDFFSDTDTYISEHFAFRSQLVTALSTVKEKALRTSAEEKVIVGKNDWLFFAETLDDYRGINQLEDKDVQRIVKTLDLMNDYVTAQGADFQFMIAPNKNSLYGELMPYYYQQAAQNTNLENLSAKLKNREYFTDVYLLLKEEKRQIYHSTDSHWNNLGAAIAFDAAMKNIKADYTDYLSMPYRVENIHRGDLYGMLYPTGNEMDAQIVFEHTPNYEYVSNFRSNEDIYIETVCKDKSDNLVVYRDSFCNALFPMFADEFSSSVFTREMPYDLNVVNEDTTAVIVELVERNLSNLLVSAPVMKAPIRADNSDLELAEKSEIYTREKDNMLHIYGKLNSEAEDDIFVSVDGVLYEAFPIYEAELIDGEPSVKSGGFSLYVPLSDTKAEIAVYI